MRKETFKLKPHAVHKEQKPPTHHRHSERRTGSELGTVPVEGAPAEGPPCSEGPEHRGWSRARECKAVITADFPDPTVCLALLQVHCLPYLVKSHPEGGTIIVRLAQTMVQKCLGTCFRSHAAKWQSQRPDCLGLQPGSATDLLCDFGQVT